MKYWYLMRRGHFHSNTQTLLVIVQDFGPSNTTSHKVLNQTCGFHQLMTFLHFMSPCLVFLQHLRQPITLSQSQLSHSEVSWPIWTTPTITLASSDVHWSVVCHLLTGSSITLNDKPDISHDLLGHSCIHLFQPIPDISCMVTLPRCSSLWWSTPLWNYTQNKDTVCSLM